MLTEQNLLEITDCAVKDISRRVAQLEMQNVDVADVDTIDFNSIVISANGNYPLTIVLCAGTCFLGQITRRMKHGEDFDENEIAIYATEFFNILCGHVITAINNCSNTVTRFGIPQFVKGRYKLLLPAHAMKELFYKSNYGPIAVQTFYPSGCLTE